MKHLLTTMFSVLTFAFLSLNIAYAEADLNVNTPAVAAVKTSMQNRHAQLETYYASGAVGFTQDGFIAVKDASLVPLSQRGALASMVKDENTDRSKLYQTIAEANGHSEWAGVIQKTFAGRWIDKAQTGWFVQKDGQWVRK